MVTLRCRAIGEVPGYMHDAIPRAGLPSVGRFQTQTGVQNSVLLVGSPYATVEKIFVINPEGLRPKGLCPTGT